MKERYNGITGLKAFSIMMIVLVHVACNGKYQIDGFVFNSMIKKLSVFVELFFMLSAFSMCCGYYEKIKNNEISLKDFYLRRYSKILPFFAVIVILDLLNSGITGESVFESFLNLTLTYGFLPDSTMKIVGVGWALGVIFAFYILFPFFVFLLWNKKSAWFSLVCFFLISFFGNEYLDFDNKLYYGNIMRWLYIFLIGGLIYLYKDRLTAIFKKRQYILIILFVLFFALEIVLYQQVDIQIIKKCILFSFAILITYSFAGNNIFGNRLFVFLGKYCLEIYLSHMILFRIFQKIGCTHLMQNEIASFVIAYVLTLLATIVFVIIAKRGIDFGLTCVKKWSKRAPIIHG